jgi:hypothetical protein
MLYLAYEPIAKNRWTVRTGGKSKPVAEVRLHRNGRCTLTAPRPLPLETIDAITAFMALVKEPREALSMG